MGLAIAGGVVFWLLSDSIAHLVFGDSQAAGDITWLALGVALSVAAASQLAYLKGMRMIGDLARVNIITGFIATVLGIIAIFLWRNSGVTVLVLLVPLTTFVTGYYFVARANRTLAKIPRPACIELAAEFRGLTLLGIAFMLSALAMTGAELAVRSMVQQRLGEEALGQFQASWSIGMIYLAVILGALATDYYPRLTGIINDRQAANRTINQQSEAVLLLCAPLLLGVLSLAPWVVRLLYSVEFVPAVDILHWQLLGDTLKILNLPLGYVVIAKGAGRIYIVIQALGAGTLVGITYLGLPWIGVAATGVAFIAMYVVVLPLNLIAARYWLGFRWSRSVKLQASVLTLGAVTLVALGNVSDLAAAIAGVPLSIAFAGYALLRLSRVADVGGPVARFIRLSRSIRNRIA